jgi:hypothetical protein
MCHDRLTPSPDRREDDWLSGGSHLAGDAREIA